MGKHEYVYIYTLIKIRLVDIRSICHNLTFNCFKRVCEMAPTIPEKKNPSAILKLQKQERKKWKKENLLKKGKALIEKKTETKTLAHSKSLPEVSTISIAVPGSILENAQSPELRTYVAGQIARAACIFQVDEIIIFDDGQTKRKTGRIEPIDIRPCCAQLARILQYLECPQYLRKFLFPVHKDLSYVGILNPLDAPHHLRAQDNFKYREGIITNKPVKEGRGSKVNVGLLKDVEVDKLLTPGRRCTVELLSQENNKKLKGIVVSPSTPRRAMGIYWGYSVRIAKSLAEVFSKSPYKNGYDYSIGTSDKGDTIDNFNSPKFEHLLIVFGGLAGLEVALENDEVLPVNEPQLLFDFYINTVPNQGSRTIRTEEAILVSLTALRPKLTPKNPPKDCLNFS